MIKFIFKKSRDLSKSQKSIVLVSILMTIIWVGCSRIYTASFENTTDQAIQIVIVGDSLIQTPDMKLLQSLNNIYLYEMAPDSHYFLLEQYNKDISPESIYFSALKIIVDSDTTSLDSPEEIFERMEKCKRNYILKID